MVFERPGSDMQITMVGTGYVGRIRRRNDPCFPVGLDAKLLPSHEDLVWVRSVEFSVLPLSRADLLLNDSFSQF